MDAFPASDVLKIRAGPHQTGDARQWRAQLPGRPA